MKKGQSMGINVVVVAVLALLILVIIILIATGRLQVFSRESGSCTTQGGACVSEVQGCGETQFTPPGARCVRDDQVCCVTLG